MNLKIIVAFFSILFLSACINKRESPTNLLAKTIEHYGGDRFLKSTISYTSGNFDYEITRDGYRTTSKISRVGEDSTLYSTVLKDRLVTEFINGVEQPPRENRHALITQRIESSVYAISIPHVLNANDIEIKEQGQVEVGLNTYNILYAKTKFIEDIDINQFYLYIDSETNNIAFISQDYRTESGKNLFKRFYNHRTINGLRFADYTTFIPKDDAMPISEMIHLFNIDYFKPLQETTFTNISVTYTDR